MNVRKLVMLAMFLALGMVLPMAFHFGGPGLGRVFLPMHIPVLICGLLMGPVAGLLVGLITPVLNSFLTGMPPLLPSVPIMVVELAVYGLLTGYLYQKLEWNILVVLPVSMLAGRFAAGLTVWFLVTNFGFDLPANPLFYSWGTITTGLPGILIQLVLIPLLIRYLGNRVSEKGWR